MPFVPTPTSSNVSGYEYDPQTAQLVVEFRNGSRYRYSGVPSDTVETLSKAESAGQYFNKVIKTAYLHERLEELPQATLQNMRDTITFLQDLAKQQAAQIKNLEAQIQRV